MIQSVDLNRIQLFIEVVRAGNLTKAARVLGLKKAKLSRDLALLEQELGTQLVYRTTRQFSLTESGQKLFDGATESLGYLNTLLEKTAKGSEKVEGHIRITAPEDIGQLILIPILSKFKYKYPMLSFDIILSSSVIDLVANNIDLAVRAGSLKDSSLKKRSIGGVQTGLYCSPKIFSILCELSGVESLSQVPVVSFSSKSRKPYWNLVSQKSKKKIFIKPSFTANSYTAIKDLIEAGHGVGILPHYVCKEGLLSGKLVHVYKEWSMVGATVQLLYPNQKEIPCKIKSISDFLIKEMRVVF